MTTLYRLTFAGTFETSAAPDFAAVRSTLRGLYPRDWVKRSVTGGFVTALREFVLVAEGEIVEVEKFIADLQAVLPLGGLELLERSEIVTRRFRTNPLSVLREDPEDDDMLGRLHRMLIASPTLDVLSVVLPAWQTPPQTSTSSSTELSAPLREATPVRASFDELRQELGAMHPWLTSNAAKDWPSHHARAQLSAFNRAHGVLYLDNDGVISHVNDLYLSLLGYELSELVGRSHAVLVPESERDQDEYARFRDALKKTRHLAGEYKRRRKDGSAVWVRAVYTPMIDDAGAAIGVVCRADDVTGEMLARADHGSQIHAIHKSHAVVTFDMHGIVLDANDNFLQVSRYRLDEIVGRHHRIFVDPAYQHGSEYAAFWRNLAQGLHQAGEFKRITKDGQEIWLQATYNPIFDLEGKPIKVVKYATAVTEERLRQAQQQSQIAAIHKAQCVISFDLAGTILDANENFLKVTGYRLSEVRGRHHSMFVDADYAESSEYLKFWANLSGGRHHSGEYRRLAKNGREVWLRATYNPIFDTSGRPFQIVKYATEVTAEKLRQVDFEGQIASIRKSQCVITLALDGTILDLNENYLELLDYTLDQLKGQKHALIARLDETNSDEYRRFWSTLRRGEFVSGVFKRFGQSGHIVWMQASYNPIFDLDGRPVKIISYSADVSSNIALAAAFEDARKQAQRDPSTSLPNRARLSSYMRTALAQPGARVTVIFIDFDGFKPINDTYGHAAGDRVLSEFADRLRCILGADQLAARVGGDEFVLCASDLDDDEIASLCQRLIAAAAEPISFEDVDLRVNVSLGVAMSPNDGMDAEELLRRADIALYRSKRRGGRTFTFYADDTNEKVEAYRILAADVERGVAADVERGVAAGEFFLEYQPRFCTLTRTIKSVEALVRWQHPERGRLPPAEFITSAEKSGAILKLGEWVLRSACRAALEWEGVNVSVNLSAVQFRKTDMLGIVSSVLQETGLEARRLELEITESVLLANADELCDTLARLKRLGVTLAMDDFGTGYSSLSSLRTFPFDVVKIDRQFVADIGKRAGGRNVMRAIIGLARALSLSVTAEGVETEEQAIALAEDDCEEMQGYLLARPVSAAEVAKMIGKAWAVAA